MKLIVEVNDYLGEVDVYQYFKSDPEESRTVKLTKQAESVARLAEVAKEIETAVMAYYAKESKYDEYGNPIPASPEEMCKQ